MSKFDQEPETELTICVVGSLLGLNPSHVTTQGQILADRLKNEGYQVVCTSSKANRFLRLADIISTLIRGRNRIDLIVLEIYSGLYFILADVASVLARFFDIPMIFVLHGGNLSAFSAHFRAWVKRVLYRADVLVAPSTYHVKGLAGLGIPIRVIPNIVEIANYPLRPRTQIQPKLLWMRAFHAHYHPQMAVKALDLIRRKYPDASLVMAGVDKELEPEIKKLVDEMGLKAAVRFPGFLGPEAKLKEFSEADIFLNTNRIDNMPVAVIEARAMGLPVVATCVGGIPEIITDGQDGLLVPDGDVAAMADAVISLTESPELAEHISKNGRLFSERSSWDAVRANWEGLFDEIIRPQSEACVPNGAQRVSN